MVWAVTNKFNHYMIGSEFDVYINISVLSYINAIHKRSACD